MKARIKELEGQLKESRYALLYRYHKLYIHCSPIDRKTVNKLGNIGADRLLVKLDSILEKGPPLKRLPPATFRTLRAPKEDENKIGWTKDNENTKHYRYFTDEDGKPYPEKPWRQQLLSTARGILTDAAIRTGYHHSDWRSNGRDFKEHFITSIEEAFPTLAQCEAHWKAIQLAQDHYPTWVKSFWKDSIETTERRKQSCNCGALGAAKDRKHKLEDVDEPDKLSIKRLKPEPPSTTFNQIQVFFLEIWLPSIPI